MVRDVRNWNKTKVIQLHECCECGRRYYDKMDAKTCDHKGYGLKCGLVNENAF